jgi:hypothetical protein
MFGEVAFALAERTTVADYSNMKPALVHPSPTVPAAFAAVLGILLAVFLLPGAGIQGEPITLSPAIGGGAGRVAADLPATAYRRASEPLGGMAFLPQLGATRIEHFVLQPRQAASDAQRVHRRARTGAERRAPPAPVQVAAPAAPATPLTARRVGASTKAKGEARGHGGRLKPAAGGPAPGGHGHGKGSGGSSEHHHGLPPRHTNRAPTAPPDPAPATPPKANGGGNGGKGGKK